ncbi:MAG: hypothetical protein NZ922_04760 [Candidatus Methanomethyliaceae archaeon]|nr:hypothetical protein [Candidatus Methanomethyliaceae archaeon]MDW7971400.1 transcriptional regulator [Nitrososphaerota archaeon]
MNEIEVPLKPMGREDIQKLEALLLLATVSRRDVIEKMREANAKDRLTWIDSLAIAAGALAREKAGMSAIKIAEELGRGEQTIRAHLTKRTEAGRLVRETYEMLLKGENMFPFLVESNLKEENEKLKQELKKEQEERAKVQEELNKLKEKMKKVINIMEELLVTLKK